MLRATNTGVTAVIDPNGRIVDKLPQFQVGLLKATVRGYTGATPYARVGNWLVVVLALVSLLAVRFVSLRRATPASADLRAAP